jgi:hypothetical protein
MPTVAIMPIDRCNTGSLTRTTSALFFEARNTRSALKASQKSVSVLLSVPDFIVAVLFYRRGFLCNADADLFNQPHEPSCRVRLDAVVSYKVSDGPPFDEHPWRSNTPHQRSDLRVVRNRLRGAWQTPLD